MPLFSKLEKHFINSKFGKIIYRITRGEGPVLILIHGLASSGKSWSKFIEYIPNNFTLIIPDLLGHGESNAPEIEYNVMFQKEILLEIIKTEMLPNYSVMGHSYGGWIASILAIDNPSIQALILEDAGGLKGFFDEIVGTEKREQYKKTIIEKSLQLNANEHVVSSILSDEFSTNQLTSKELLKINAKTLILWGMFDTVIDKKFAFIFQKLIKNSEVKILNSKHTSHYTIPETTAKEVVDFIFKSIKK